MILFGILLVSRLNFTLNCSYVTKVNEVASLPVEIVSFKPVIEYGERFGLFSKDLYLSLDCDNRDNVSVVLGANCFQAGVFYRWFFGKGSIAGGGGGLRIDVAGLGHGSIAGVEYSGQFDVERTGIYLDIRPGFVGAYRNMPLYVEGIISFSMVQNGKLYEYGGGVSFMPFKNKPKGVWEFLNSVNLTAGLSYIQFAAETEDFPFSLEFWMYSIGIGMVK